MRGQGDLFHSLHMSFSHLSVSLEMMAYMTGKPSAANAY